MLASLKSKSLENSFTKSLQYYLIGQFENKMGAQTESKNSIL